MPSTFSPSERGRLAALAVVMLLPSLGTSIANVALPTLKLSFAASTQEVQWVVIAYLLAVTSLIVAAGRLGDLFGRQRLLLVGIGIFTVASAGGAFASSLWALIAARGLQGVGAALMMSLAVAMVGDLVPKERTGSAMGLMGTVSAAGTAMGPSLGGVLVSSLGWPAIFALMALAGAAAFPLARRVLPLDPRRESPPAPPNAVGAAVLALALGAYALSTTLDADWPVRAGLAAGSLLGLVAFVAVESKAVSPLIRLELLGDRGLTTGLVALALVSTILMATLVVGPFYLSGVLDLDPMRIGLVMTVGPGIAALTGVPAGRMVDRFGPRAVTLGGLVGVLLGSALMMGLPGTLRLAGYIASLALVTMSYALFQAANTTAILNRAPADQRGVTSALVALARNLGLVTGASAMGALFALGSRLAGSQGPAAAGEAGLQATFGVAAVLAGLALAAVWAGGRQRVPFQAGETS